MRILLPVHHIPPRHAAGTEMYTVRLAAALARRGHDVRVLATDDDPLPDPGTVTRSESDGFGVIQVAVPRIARAPSDSWSGETGGRAFTSEVDAFRPEVVHFQHLMGLGFAAPARARASGARVLMTLHDYWLLCPRDGQLVTRAGIPCAGPGREACAACLEGYRFGHSPAEWQAARKLASLRRFSGLDLQPLARRAGLLLRRFRGGSAGKEGRNGDRAGILSTVDSRSLALRTVTDSVELFIAPSQFLEETFVAAGFDRNRLVHVPHGMDGGGRTGGSRRPGPLRIGYFGTVIPSKGVDILVEAAGRMPAGTIEVRIHGRDDQRPEFTGALRRRARGLPVSFRGRFAPEEARALLADVDVTVVPSRWYENRPLAALESLANGVPVVVADIGALPELVSGGANGWTFRAGDPDDLARVLGRLASDRECVAAVGRSLKPPVDMATHAARIEALYGRGAAGAAS